MRKVDSHFIADFFLYYFDKEKEVTLSQCIKIVKTDSWFRDFQAKEILHYHFLDEKSKEKLLPILDKFYQEEICKHDFVNSVKQKGDVYHLGHERLLVEIYEKYAFYTQEDILMKMVWQVLDGFYHLKEASYGDKKTKKVSHLIIENVSKGKLVAYILSNLENGIEADLVFKSHIEFCRHLKVHQAKNALFTQIELNRFKDYEQVHAINIFLELNGEKSKLFSLFKNCVDFNGYQYIELAKVLKENYKNDVANSLSSLLDCDDVTQERKMEVAQLLAEIGWTKGFAFIIDSIVKNAVVPSDLFHVMPLDCLCSQEILNELDKIVHHIFDENSRTANNSRHIPSVKDFLLDCLYKIAQKGEGDLALTEEFLNAAQEKLKSEYPDSKDILFHVDRIVEKTRELDKAHYEILELKELLNNVRM